MIFGIKHKSQLGLILLLFVHTRIMMLVILPADHLTLYGDYHYYFDLASLTETGYLPFIHYWSEYPPLFPFVNLGLYWLSGGVFHRYVVLTGLFFLAFEVSSLILLYHLAGEKKGRLQAIWICWVYMTLYLPIFIWLRQFDIMAALAFLLALFMLRRRRLTLTGLVIGMGTAIKLVPILLLVTVWRELGWRKALTGGVATLLVIAAIFGPLFMVSPDFTWASILAQPSKSSWQTVWALIDGNLTNTGNFGAIEEHFEPALAIEPLYNPSLLPGWLTALPFAALGLFILRRPVRHQDDDIIFTTLMLILFFIWSKGWSPQWQIYLYPLLLLSLPLRRAVIFILVLSTINFIEWPIILSRGLVEYLPITIIARTMMLVWLGLLLYQQLGQSSIPAQKGSVKEISL